VVMTSHLLHEVQMTCDRIGILNRGKLVLKETMRNLNQTMTGGEDRRVEFRLTEVTPDLIRDLESLKGVKSVTQNGDSLYVYNGAENDAEVSRTITRHGSTILLMKPKEYTLEEIFMKYYREAN